MIYRIQIWERSSGDHRPVGEMICEVQDNGRTQSAFRCHEGYLSRLDSFALDPVSLPLNAGIFSTPAHGIFGVFEDQE